MVLLSSSWSFACVGLANRVDIRESRTDVPYAPKARIVDELRHRGRVGGRRSGTAEGGLGRQPGRRCAEQTASIATGQRPRGHEQDEHDRRVTAATTTSGQRTARTPADPGEQEPDERHEHERDPDGEPSGSAPRRVTNQGSVVTARPGRRCSRCGSRRARRGIARAGVTSGASEGMTMGWRVSTEISDRPRSRIEPRSPWTAAWSGSSPLTSVVPSAATTARSRARRPAGRARPGLAPGPGSGPIGAPGPPYAPVRDRISRGSLRLNPPRPHPSIDRTAG